MRRVLNILDFHEQGREHLKRVWGQPRKSVQLRGALREESMYRSGKTEELICTGKFYKAKKGMNNSSDRKKSVIRNSRSRKGRMTLYESKREGHEMLLLYKEQDKECQLLRLKSL